MKSWQMLCVAVVAIAMVGCGAEVKVDDESGDISVKAPGGIDVQVKGGDDGGKVSVKGPGVEVNVDGDNEGGKVSVKAPGVDVQVEGNDAGGDVAVKAPGVNVKVKGDAKGEGGDVTVTTSDGTNVSVAGKDDAASDDETKSNAE